jgi:replication initiation and membrane attachment protein
MRVTNILHFTENHRFTVHRSFALSPLDGKMLQSVYQPMIGAMAVGLYYTLYHQVPADKSGFSPLEQQRKLFLAMELEPGEKGRRLFIELSSRLEAVGLLETTRKFIPDGEDYVYEYELQAPLAPDEFFKNQHLLLLLRDKIGKHSVLHLSRELIEPRPEELRDAAEERLSVPFYELFRLNTRIIDYELEQAFQEMAPAKSPGIDTVTGGFQYADIIVRFPKGSRNRAYVESLKYRPDELARINFVAKKYALKLPEVCRLLDEDDLFEEDGTVRFDALQQRANLIYRQERKREEERNRLLARFAELKAAADADGGNAPPKPPEQSEEKPVEMAYYLEVPPLFHGRLDIHQYNTLLRNEPYTYVLQMFFPGGRVPDGVLNIFEKIDLQYGISEEVINAMIHFIHIDRRSWSKTSIEFVASDMLGKQVTTYEQAVSYIREQLAYKEKLAGKNARQSQSAAANGRARGVTKKPNIPIIRDVPDDAPVTEEEFEAIRRKAQKLDRKIER